MGTNIAPKVLIILFTAALQKDRPATIFVRRGAHHVSGWRILGVEQEVAWETHSRDFGPGGSSRSSPFPWRQANGWVVQHLHGRFTTMFSLFPNFRGGGANGIRRTGTVWFRGFVETPMYIEWSRLTGRGVQLKTGRRRRLELEDTPHLTLQKRRSVGQGASHELNTKRQSMIPSPSLSCNVLARGRNVWHKAIGVSCATGSYTHRLANRDGRTGILVRGEEAKRRQCEAARPAIQVAGMRACAVIRGYLPRLLPPHPLCSAICIRDNGRTGGRGTWDSQVGDSGFTLQSN
jgi:hypothetical protein